MSDKRSGDKMADSPSEKSGKKKRESKAGAHSRDPPTDRPQKSKKVASSERFDKEGDKIDKQMLKKAEKGGKKEKEEKKKEEMPSSSISETPKISTQEMIDKMAPSQQPAHEEDKAKSSEKPKAETKQEQGDLLPVNPAKKKALQLYENSEEAKGKSFQSKSHEKLIDEFGYYYNSKGFLRSVNTESIYKFTKQSEYEDLCKTIVSYIQELHKNILGMEEHWIPLKEDNDGEVGKNNIFYTKDYFKNSDKCLILIQGTGQVRAGIWARYCCINESLDIGSMIPYVRDAQKEGYSVIMFNPNMSNDDSGKSIKHCRTMESHCNYVWERFVANGKCPAKRLYIVCHSAGGYCTYQIMKSFTEDFMNRVKCVALTDSFFGSGGNKKEKQFIKKRLVHFEASSAKLGADLGLSYSGEYQTFSAGHPKHEYASGYARQNIFDYFRTIDSQDAASEGTASKK